MEHQVTLAAPGTVFLISGTLPEKLRHRFVPWHKKSHPVLDDSRLGYLATSVMVISWRQEARKEKLARVARRCGLMELSYPAVDSDHCYKKQMGSDLW